MLHKEIVDMLTFRAALAAHRQQNEQLKKDKQLAENQVKPRASRVNALENASGP